jgi:hypothetical protein
MNLNLVPVLRVNRAADAAAPHQNRRLVLRPLLEHPRPPPDGEPDPRPMLDRLGEQLTSFFQVVACVKQALDLRTVLSPLFDLVEIAIVGIERVLGLFEPKSVFLLRPPIAH